MKIACRSKGSNSEQKQQRVQLIQQHGNIEAAYDAAGCSTSCGEKAAGKLHEEDFWCLEISDLNNNKEEQEFKQTCSRDCEGNPMYEYMVINGIKIKMEIDTGTYATVISSVCHANYLRDCKIEKTERKLKTYDEKILQPIGKLTNLVVNFKNQKRILECFVLPGSGPALVGRQWLAAFGLWPLQIGYTEVSAINKLNTEELVEVLREKYSELFSETPGLYNKSESKIYLKENARPIALKCRNVAHALKPLVEKELDRLVNLGHLKPVEISEWSTPIVPVFKSNGKVRVCGDFKLTLNQFIIIDKYPLHTIDDIFTVLQGGNSFSELDLTHMYMQFPVDEESSKLLTIVTHKGLFRYTKIPEGVSPAPADVQRKMDECLRGIDSAISYLDNIYVTGKTDEEHLNNLHKVCNRLQACGLRLNKEKCHFMKDKLEVLGYVIDKVGLHKAKSKVNAMVNAPQPKNSKELASFLGLVNFYARFLENRSDNLKPLYDLANNEKYEWNENCSKAFEWVKNELISPKVLVNYNPNEEVVLSCDASDYGLSAILSHRYKNGEEKPIAYASKKIAKDELNRKILDKEAMAIVFGFKRFYQFIFGKVIILKTDNKALQLILGPRKGIPQTADNRFQRWAYYLSGFRYEIEHVKSEANANCDALSRLPIEDETDLIDTSFSHVNFFEEGVISYNYKTLAEESKKDELIMNAIRYVLGNWPKDTSKMSNEMKILFNKRLELTVEKGCLFWGLRAVIPGSMKTLILNELHATHLGIVKIKMFARSYVWWPNIDHDIESMINNCKICLIQRKRPPHTPLTTWPYPDKVWGRIHCDFAELFGKMYLIMVDAHSKWPEIINFNNNTKAYRLIEEFKKLFARYGFPLHCVTDGGPQFRSEEFHTFLVTHGVKHSLSPPYHPATNGAAENFVQIFKDKVKKIVNGGESVNNAVNMFLFDYRSIEHCTTRRSPAYLMYRRELRTRFDLLRPNVNETVETKQGAQIVARPGKRNVDFQIGDKVVFDDYGIRSGKRMEGTIVQQRSPSTFVVKDNNEVLRKRHVDQMLKSKKAHVKVRRSPRLHNTEN